MAEEYKQSEFSRRVEELMDDGFDFGAAVKEAMKEEEARKNLAGGGILNYTGNMMRSNYAMGSDDIPEIEETSSDEYRDLLKSLNAPAENQASGIRSLDRAPSIKQEKPEMKMADAMLMEEYEKYAYDMIEQGLEPMPLQQFIDQILAEARMGVNVGGMMRANYKAGSPNRANPFSKSYEMMGGKKKEIDLPERLYDNPFDAREAGDKEDRAMYRDMEKTNIPVKKTNNSIDLDVEAIKKLIEKRKKEKQKRAKGGIAGVL
jgi:hypothetical protein